MNITAINGEMIKITHTSSSLLSNVPHFQVNDISVIPNDSKDLMCVYHFCVDNHAYMEFDHQKLRIQVVDTMEILTEGEQENGLY